MSEEKKNSKEVFGFMKNWKIFSKLKQVKHIGLIVTIIFVLILIAILFGDFNFSFLGSKNTVSQTIASNSTYTSSTEYAKFLEDKLKTILGKIKGAGDVEVMLSVDGGKSVLLASDSQTTTVSGKNSETTTSVVASPIILESSGSPMVIGEVLPNITGVVVVSSGAKDVQVRLNILSAVKTLLNLEETKIVILIGE